MLWRTGPFAPGASNAPRVGGNTFFVREQDAELLSPFGRPRPQLTLARVSKGRVEHAAWVHVHGPEGVGKSSFGAAAPEPIFIDVEQGTMNLETTRFTFDDAGRTMPGSFDEFLEAVRVVERESHPYKTLIVDTLDAVEALIWRHICHRDQKANISDYGFGNGENRPAVRTVLDEATVFGNTYHQEAVVQTAAGSETHGGTDVFLGAIGKGAENFSGAMENIDVHAAIRKAIGL